MTDEYLTIGQVAELLQCSERTIRRWVFIGKLKASKPAGFWLFKRQDIDSCLENHSFDLDNA